MTASNSIEVIGTSHPLENTLEQFNVPVGMTISDIVDLAITHKAQNLIDRNNIVIRMGSESVPRDFWDHVRPKAGSVVIFQATMHDNGLFRGVASIAIGIASLFVAPVLGPVLFPTLTAGLSTAIVGTAMTLGGALLINALFPLRPPQLDSSANKRINFFNVNGNSVRPWEPVSCVLGRIRVFPDLAALPYTSIRGNDQFLHQIFEWNIGPVLIEDERLGKTSIDRFDEITRQHRYGFDTDEPITNYPGQAHEEEPLNIELKQSDSWHTRRTHTDSDEIVMEFVAINGIFRRTDDGEYQDFPVTIQSQYRRVGDVSWTDMNDVTFTRTKITRRRGISVEVPRGEYDVRTRRSTDDNSSDNVVDTVVWYNFKTFTHEDPINFPKPLAKTGMKARATNQLNGTVRDYNAIVTSLVNAYNGSTWVADQPSRNCADLFRHVLQGLANVIPEPDSKIDIENLQEWWHYCHDNGFNFDYRATARRPRRELLADIAAAGRATVSESLNGKWGVIFNEKDDEPAWQFTPRNSWGFSGRQLLKRQPHALRVRFIDSTDNYEERERVVYDDGYTGDNATEIEVVEFPGVTDPDVIFKHARFQLAQARLRPATYTLNADVEGLRVTRGDRVYVQHDVTPWGTGNGRVKSIDGQVITLDSAVTFEVGLSYNIRFLLLDGGTLLREVINTGNETNVITLDGSGAVPDEGCMFSFGEPDLETVVLRVLDVTPGSGETFVITFVDDAPEIFDADTGPIPVYDPGVSHQPDPFEMAPEALIASEDVDGIGILAKSVVRLSTQLPRLGNVRALEYQYKDVDVGGDWEALETVLIPTLTANAFNLEEGSWQFRVRCLFEDQTYSDWVESDNLTVSGLSDPPADVTGFRGESRDNSTRFTWDRNNDANFSHYTLKYSAETDGSATWGSSVTQVAQIISTEAILPTKVGTWLIKAVTFQGEESLNAATFISTVEGSTTNVVETITEDPNFLGVHDNTERDGNNLRLAYTSPSYETEGTYYFLNLLDLGNVYTSHMTALLTASGNDIGNVMSSWPTLESVDALDNSDPSDWGVKFYYQFTDDDPYTTGADWSDWIEFGDTDVTARGIRWKITLFGTQNITPLISALGVLVDMPDRHEVEKDLNIPAGGLTITFDPAFKALKGITVGVQDLETGDRVAITSKSETGFSIRVFNSGGTGVSRTFDYDAVGYGKVV